jgi:hypothetical protein
MGTTHPGAQSATNASEARVAIVFFIESDARARAGWGLES